MQKNNSYFTPIIILAVLFSCVRIGIALHNQQKQEQYDKMAEQIEIFDKMNSGYQPDKQNYAKNPPKSFNVIRESDENAVDISKKAKERRKIIANGDTLSQLNKTKVLYHNIAEDIRQLFSPELIQNGGSILFLDEKTNTLSLVWQKNWGLYSNPMNLGQIELEKEGSYFFIPRAWVQGKKPVKNYLNMKIEGIRYLNQSGKVVTGDLNLDFKTREKEFLFWIP